MAVPWPDRPLLGVFHVHQAHAVARLGGEVVLFGPAPAIPRALGAVSPKARRHLERPRRYRAGDVTVDAPRVPFAYPEVVRGPLARAWPGGVLGLADRALARALDAHIAEFRPDALLAHGIVPWGEAVARAAARAGIPHAFIEHSATDLARLRPGSRLAARARRCAARAAAVFVVGPQMFVQARDVLGFEHVALLPNGALRLAAPPPARPAGLDGRFVVLTAANYYRRKGLEELLLALAPVVARHPSVELHLVTAAPPRLRRLAVDLGVSGHVVWHEPMPPEELLAWMAWADLFAMPSWDEAFGLVYVEALAAGTPVLASADSGFAHYAMDWARHHGSPATIVAPHSVESLALGLLDALEDPDALAATARTGAAMVTEWFDWDRNAACLLEGLGLRAPESAPGSPDDAHAAVAGVGDQARTLESAP